MQHQMEEKMARTQLLRKGRSLGICLMGIKAFFPNVVLIYSYTHVLGKRRARENKAHGRRKRRKVVVQLASRRIMWSQTNSRALAGIAATKVSFSNSHTPLLVLCTRVRTRLMEGLNAASKAFSICTQSSQQLSSSIGGHRAPWGGERDECTMSE